MEIDKQKTQYYNSKGAVPLTLRCTSGGGGGGWMPSPSHKLQNSGLPSPCLPYPTSNLLFPLSTMIKLTYALSALVVH